MSAHQERSHKAWVRKHQPSYWSVWFGKNKKKSKHKDKEITKADQGSRQECRPDQGQHPGNTQPQQDFPQQQGSPFDQGPVSMGFANQQANMNTPAAPAPAFGHPAGNISSNRRDVHPEELEAHMRTGGQTNAGEVPRGASQGQGNAHSPTRARVGTKTSRRSAYGHPWIPETKAFEGEKTRRR
ncbi:hypothetical protein BDU57DRAFT_543391 [Ampelomyces quisqualis]|uniref:Uncharacterized protein n=1 Tax=Ampelomyces quisqualis TaxID=50730 RepID=A0A6A5Q9G5_AMPQU|nr:hypothetical protein BDU57DRAFT_543391 [Ampelomyces quisqualis]